MYAVWEVSSFFIEWKRILSNGTNTDLAVTSQKEEIKKRRRVFSHRR